MHVHEMDKCLLEMENGKERERKFNQFAIFVPLQMVITIHTIGFESISQVMFNVCFSAALITLPSYWHIGGSIDDTKRIFFIIMVIYN